MNTQPRTRKAEAMKPAGTPLPTPAFTEILSFMPSWELMDKAMLCRQTTAHAVRRVGEYRRRIQQARVGTIEVYQH